MPRRDVVSALLEAAPEGEADAWRQLCEMFTAIYHFEFHAELEVMKRAYAPFNPDLDDERFDAAATPTPERAQVLADRLHSVLERGNYERLDDSDMRHAFDERSLFSLSVVVDTDVYEDIVIYARGDSVREVEVDEWFGLRKRTLEIPTFDRVCFYLRFKTEAKLGLASGALSRHEIEPGTTVLKLFRSIPKADLEILFPNCELRMRMTDKVMLGVPALLGGIPVIAKLIPAVLAVGILLGLRGGEIDKGSIIAGLTGLVVLGSYLFRQWDKFRSRRLMFNGELSENLYFRNLDNNEGVLTRLVDEAEEEECKEALLAFFTLHLAGEPLARAELDRRVEAWIGDRFQVEVDFDDRDALAKLERFGLVVEDDEGRWTTCSLADARTTLGARWDGFLGD